MTWARVSSLWRAFAAYGLWAVCFTALYTGHALGCVWLATDSPPAFMLSAEGLVLALAVIWLIFVVWMIIMSLASAARFRRHGGTFMNALTFWVDATAVVITVVTGLPIILTQVCV